MYIKEYEEFTFIQNDLISKEMFILYSIFGEESKFLQVIQQEWFETKEVEKFRDFIEIKFDEIEIKKKNQVDRDSLSCLLRMMSICDCFFEYEYIYDSARTLFINSNKETMSNLKVYDYAFKEFIESNYISFLEELKSLTISTKYNQIVNDIKKTINRVSEISEFSLIVKETYKINDLMSDLLDILEDDEDNSFEFSTDEEVVLYNFSIYHSTKIYFSLLLRENIILEEERISGKVIESYKPLIEEEDLRMSETKMISDQSKEIFYKTLKN
ncbi:hypothetical protein [Spiroplasma diminutum]|uniref:Uncharacterized protein n=1 Tax=Spiroplasma diminutum CUAS-1 TaxID=1276221 RepID=S5LVL9_9MOLU|nr:hypothetical protein [Spiroplasma diminutum]AGR41879.1 hypothetical protein SDIMI_v3c01750 [Spiroplasma diminutum CUAS-1]